MKDNSIINVSIEVEDDNTSHTNISCGNNRSFGEVLKGLELCRDELQRQIDERKKCPMYKKYEI